MRITLVLNPMRSPTIWLWWLMCSATGVLPWPALFIRPEIDRCWPILRLLYGRTPLSCRPRWVAPQIRCGWYLLYRRWTFANAASSYPTTFIGQSIDFYTRGITGHLDHVIAFPQLA